MLLNLAGVKYTDEESKEGLMSPSGDLPFLMSSTGRSIAGPELVTLLLEQITKNGTDEYAEIRKLVSKDIRPLWMAQVWSEPAIFEYILKPLYAPTYCHPIRELLIWKRQRSLSSSARITDASLEAFDNALSHFEEMLGDARFFGGADRVNVVDALVGPDLMFIPFYLPASHRLHQVFSQHHNLYDYAMHMLEYLRETVSTSSSLSSA